MKKLWNAFRDWLIEVWDFVPREDYAFVQRRALKAEERVKLLIEAQDEILDGVYARKYAPFEKLGDVTIEMEEIARIDIASAEFRWVARIPYTRFLAAFDPKREMDMVKRYALGRLTESFRRHVREQLFGEPKRIL